MCKKVLAFAFVLALLTSLVEGVQVVAASSQTDYPLASGIYIRSPTNRTYTSSLLTLNASVTGLVASNIKISMTYSLDGMTNNTLPTVIHSREHSFQATIIGTTDLPTLSCGSHNITIYAKYEVNDASMEGVYYSKYVIYDNSTVYFTIRTNSVQEISEFPSWIPLLIMLVAVVIVAFIYRRKLQNRG